MHLYILCIYCMYDHLLWIYKLYNIFREWTCRRKLWLFRSFCTCCYHLLIMRTPLNEHCEKRYTKIRYRPYYETRICSLCRVSWKQRHAEKYLHFYSMPSMQMTDGNLLLSKEMRYQKWTKLSVWNSLSYPQRNSW